MRKTLLACMLASWLGACSSGPSTPDPAALPAGNGWQCFTGPGRPDQVGACRRACTSFAGQGEGGAVAPAICDAVSSAWCATWRYGANPTREWACFQSVELCRRSRAETATGGPDELSECGEVP